MISEAVLVRSLNNQKSICCPGDVGMKRILSLAAVICYVGSYHALRYWIQLFNLLVNFKTVCTYKRQITGS